MKTLMKKENLGHGLVCFNLYKEINRTSGQKTNRKEKDWQLLIKEKKMIIHQSTPSNASLISIACVNF